MRKRERDNHATDKKIKKTKERLPYARHFSSGFGTKNRKNKNRNTVLLKVMKALLCTGPLAGGRRIIRAPAPAQRAEGKRHWYSITQQQRFP